MTTRSEVLNKIVQDQNNVTAAHQALVDGVVDQFERDDHKLIAKTLMNNQLEYLATNSKLDNTRQDLLLDVCAKLVKEVLAIGDIVGVQPQKKQMYLVYSLVIKQKEGVDPMDNSNNPLVLEVISTEVEANPIKLSATFSGEFIGNLDGVGLDVSESVSIVAAEEVGYEICAEIVNDLLELAKDNTTNLNHSDGLSLADHAENVIHGIKSQANDIARKTRRGVGNVIVCSPSAANNLQMYIELVKERTSLEFKHIVDPESDEGHKPALNYIGNVVYTNTNNTTEKVLYKVFVIDCMPDIDNQDMYLIGYKGVSATDNGYVYCPYQLVISDGLTNDELTFGEVLKLSTNYAKHSRPVEDNKPSFSDSCNYYRILNVQHPKI